MTLERGAVLVLGGCAAALVVLTAACPEPLTRAVLAPAGLAFGLGAVWFAYQRV